MGCGVLVLIYFHIRYPCKYILDYSSEYSPDGPDHGPEYSPDGPDHGLDYSSAVYTRIKNNTIIDRYIKV